VNWWFREIYFSGSGDKMQRRRIMHADEMSCENFVKRAKLENLALVFHFLNGIRPTG
jgi:hypothetical protein